MTSTPQTKSQAVFSPPKSHQVSQTTCHWPFDDEPTQAVTAVGSNLYFNIFGVAFHTLPPHPSSLFPPSPYLTLPYLYIFYNNILLVKNYCMVQIAGGLPRRIVKEHCHSGYQLYFIYLQKICRTDWLQSICNEVLYPQDRSEKRHYNNQATET